jgi:hypothetical protein
MEETNVRARVSWEDNIKINPKGMCWEGME